MCVQRFDDSLEFCNSHYLSHFAAFFIDARTKRSVVESFVFYLTIVLRFKTRLVKVLNWGLSTSAGQRVDEEPSGGPEGRARRSNDGQVDKGLGDRAGETLTR